MDPALTLINLSDAIESQDYAMAVELLNSYYRWRLNGGYQPFIGSRLRLTGMQGDAFADKCAAALSDALSHLRGDR